MSVESDEPDELDEDDDLLSQFKDKSDKELKVIAKLLEIQQIRYQFATEFHVNTRAEKLDFVHHPHIRNLYNSVSPEIVLQGSVQSFKGLAIDCMVHTPTGWVQNGELRVGDAVSTPDGKGAKVKHIQELGVRQLYEFTLDDGRVIESTHDHLWKVLRGKQRATVSKGRKSLQWDVAINFEILTTERIIAEMAKGAVRFTIPVSNTPVEKPEQKLPIEPYFLGLMLGDGTISEKSLRLTTADAEIVAAANSALMYWGLELRAYPSKKIDYHFVERADSILENGKSHLKREFRKLGLLGCGCETKFIPEIYKNGSVSQRLAILQGLLDTDGGASKHGGILIGLASERMVKDLQEIVWSLGGVAKYKSRRAYYIDDGGSRRYCKTTYQLQISLPEPEKAFRLARKKANLSKSHRRTRTLGAKIVSTRAASKQPARCIILDNTEHLYIAENYIVTHNSEWAVIDHFAAAYSGISIFYVLPKVELRNTFVQNRINRCVQNVPEYKRIIGGSFFDNIALKSFGRGVIKYVGSNVLADFKEFPADMIVVDEVDECNQDHLDYALDRLRGSDYQFKRYIGNPKTKGKGINRLFQLSTMEEWTIPCPTCRSMQKVDWFTCVVEGIQDRTGNMLDYRLRDTSWSPDSNRDINLICPSCGGILERDSQHGRWVPGNPKSRIEGKHLSMLCNTINPIYGMWRRFKEATHDPSKMQQFYNSELGLPFDASGNRITDTLLEYCADQDYVFAVHPDRAHIPPDWHEGPCSMGIDVMSSAFDVRISYVEGARRRAVFIGKLPINIEALIDLMVRYGVEKVVIDAGPEFNLSQEVQELAPCDVWLCRYRHEGKTQKQTKDARGRIINTDRTEAMDRAFAQLKKRLNVLPRNFRAVLGGVYSSEMCMPVRELVEAPNGEVRFEWSKGEDHQRHCDVYDMLAASMLNDSAMDEVIIG